ncbi:VIR protein [Plasmodium vivax]|uniref:VIR protein n=1 Tax=Plasmodium vivax TaxID=5855 RepID=A0A1G4EDD8_PLAVI|nr:VIR protein [Plasmodium vivax]
MPNYLGDTEFDNLNTNFYYTSLNEAYYDCKDETFYNAAETKLKNNTWKEDVTDKILKALCYVYRKSSINNDERDICKYLYFWLVNILLDKMTNKVVFFDVIRDLFDILKNDKEKICELPHHYIEEHNFKNIKSFFDYSEDYYSYKNQITDYNLPCNEKYHKYLHAYVDTYNTFHGICQYERNSYGYCDIFDKYFAEKDHKNLSKWTCKLQDNKPEAEYPEKEKMKEQPPSAYGMVGQTLTLSEGFKRETEQDAEYPSSSVSLPRQDTFVNNSASDNSDGTHPTIISKSVTGAVSVAGALVPSYLLYNYNPAGNLINKLLGRTIRISSTSRYFLYSRRELDKQIIRKNNKDES